MDSSKQQVNQQRKLGILPSRQENPQRHGTKALSDAWRTFPGHEIRNHSSKFVMEHSNRLGDSIYRNIAFQATNNKTKYDLKYEIHPTKLTEIFSDYQVREEENLWHT